MKGCIYKLTSPSNKVYIGQTINYSKRISSYRKLLCKFQHKIYNAIKKYGFDNFVVDILYEIEINVNDKT